jgi:hypothetical protein
MGAGEGFEYSNDPLLHRLAPACGVAGKKVIVRMASNHLAGYQAALSRSGLVTARTAPSSKSRTAPANDVADLAASADASKRLLATVDSLAIKARLASECRVEARRSDADLLRQVADRDALVTMVPE